jgi:FtsH-binding integral membrane protein
MEQQPAVNQSLGNRGLGDQAVGLASIAAENARFMSRVYGWMTGGLCLTGAVAWNVAGKPDL